MDNENNIIISKYAFERMQAKEEKERSTKNVIIILLIILLVVTNAMWLWERNQYDYVDTYEVDLDSGEGGDANYIGNNGDISYGENNSTENTEQDTH